MSCPIIGDAVVERRINLDGYDDDLQWVHAAAETHIDDGLKVMVDDAAWDFIEAMYEIGERCPHQPRARHARRRDAQVSS